MSSIPPAKRNTAPCANSTCGPERAFCSSTPSRRAKASMKSPHFSSRFCGSRTRTISPWWWWETSAIWMSASARSHGKVGLPTIRGAIRLWILTRHCRGRCAGQIVWMQVSRDVGQIPHQRRQGLLRYRARDPKIQPRDAGLLHRERRQFGHERPSQTNGHGRRREGTRLLRQVRHHVRRRVRARGAVKCRDGRVKKRKEEQLVKTRGAARLDGPPYEPRSNHTSRKRDGDKA